MPGMRYYSVVKAKSSKFEIRRQMVEMAQAKNISAAARFFGTTRVTVRLWLNRYREEGWRGLQDRCRAPHHIPHKTPLAVEKKVLALRKRYPRWGVARMDVHFDLACSRTAAQRIIAQAGLTRRRKKKRNRNDLRAQKARMRPFEKVQVDTKDLSDIPAYARYMRLNKLPRYQYTARDVRTGASYFAFAQRNNSFNAALFGGYLLGHLKRHGVDFSKMIVQTDNGTEYIGHINKRKRGESLFEEVVKKITDNAPEQIPPGAKTCQSDVEAFHGMIEEELYRVEKLQSEAQLLGRARTYQVYFNHFRKNLWKGAKTPANILAEAGSKVDPSALTLPPIRLESIPLPPITGGYDVPELVTKFEYFYVTPK